MEIIAGHGLRLRKTYEFLLALLSPFSDTIPGRIEETDLIFSVGSKTFEDVVMTPKMC